jgi:hypothetical protein
VVDRFSSPFGRGNGYFQVLFVFVLPDEFGQ